MSNAHPSEPGPQGPHGPPQPPHTPAAPPPGPYGAPGPYTAPTPYGAPSPYAAAPGPHGAPGPYGPGPAGGPYPYPFTAPFPLTMPAGVRAAQSVNFSVAGLGLLLTVVVSATSGAYASGRLLSGYLLAFVLCALAFAYPKAGNGVRVASIAVAALQILMGLGSLANGTFLGIVPLGAAITVVILLTQRPAIHWFTRPRTPGR
ncbi:hypothetical protein [Streptomyces galbus]|uniref:Uncharacterized protein n=1 Tax=Streptomyces galbus TaxID=33898 RepID=A0A4U5X763_STRGB|nr:hypothetical protein [Streptomyces galbus]TKT10432.1 hypothetical protein E4U92_05705 [Streptomyces galbus]GHD22612.1 hypothetical protein GCM10010335_04010 [Streptomyces galbus]